MLQNFAVRTTIQGPCMCSWTRIRMCHMQTTWRTERATRRAWSFLFGPYTIVVRALKEWERERVRERGRKRDTAGEKHETAKKHKGTIRSHDSVECFISKRRYVPRSSQFEHSLILCASLLETVHTKLFCKNEPNSASFSVWIKPFYLELGL